MTTLQNLGATLISIRTAADKLSRLNSAEWKEFRRLQETEDCTATSFALQQMKVKKGAALFDKLEEAGDALADAFRLYEECVEELDFDNTLKSLGLD